MSPQRSGFAISDASVSSVDLRALQETWDALGKQDPFGAILEPLRGTGEWDLEEFFAWGEREIDGVLADGRRLGLPAAFGSALDFGCGAGRLTQAMALALRVVHGRRHRAVDDRARTRAEPAR